MSLITETRLLKPDGSITFPARDTPIDPNEFFNRSGVNLWGSFRGRILPILKPVASAPKRTYEVGRLNKNAYNRKIRRALPKRYLANWEDLASLIEMYPNGKEGCYFLLYMEGVGGEVFAVSVDWNSGLPEWNVRGWEPGKDVYWSAVLRVLCPGNAVL